MLQVDPLTMTSWCNILSKVPNSILWMLRFPAAGEENIHEFAKCRGIDPSRIIFSGVAPKV